MILKGELPYFTVWRILKTHIDNDVTECYVDCVKCYIEDLLEKMAEASVKELDRVNGLRQIQNLPELRRIDSCIFLNFVDKLFNYTPDFNSGEVAETSRNTTLSEAVEVA